MRKTNDAENQSNTYVALSNKKEIYKFDKFTEKNRGELKIQRGDC